LVPVHKKKKSQEKNLAGWGTKSKRTFLKKRGNYRETAPTAWGGRGEDTVGPGELKVVHCALVGGVKRKMYQKKREVVGIMATHKVKGCPHPPPEKKLKNRKT